VGDVRSRVSTVTGSGGRGGQRGGHKERFELAIEAEILECNPRPDG
jgi:hypothetical protein